MVILILLLIISLVILTFSLNLNNKFNNILIEMMSINNEINNIQKKWGDFIKMKYILGVFCLFLIMLASKIIFEMYIPDVCKWLFAFISGEIGFCVFQYFLNK